MVIQQDDEIRIKIVGTRVDATDIVSILVDLSLEHLPSPEETTRRYEFFKIWLYVPAVKSPAPVVSSSSSSSQFGVEEALPSFPTKETQQKFLRSALGRIWTLRISQIGRVVGKVVTNAPGCGKVKTLSIFSGLPIPSLANVHCLPIWGPGLLWWTHSCEELCFAKLQILRAVLLSCSSPLDLWWTTISVSSVHGFLFSIVSKQERWNDQIAQKLGLCCDVLVHWSQSC